MALIQDLLPNEQFADNFKTAEDVQNSLKSFEKMFLDYNDSVASYEKNKFNRLDRFEDYQEELAEKSSILPSTEAALTQAQVDGNQDIISRWNTEVNDLKERIAYLEKQLAKNSVGERFSDMFKAAYAEEIAEGVKERGNAVLDWVEGGSTGITGTFTFLKRTVTIN
ncbi:hypothetical protein V6R21_11935 [Limibacter armeniacum]|uniref:hypothetical protein n=1 Tax=Limibacter armeniacum TaxID=466084 RepID=UPI002FE56301